MSQTKTSTSVTVTTGICRASYVNIERARAQDGQEPKFSASLIFDPAEVNALWAAIVQVATQKWGNDAGAMLQNRALRPCLRNGNEKPAAPELQGKYFINANNKDQPVVFDVNGALAKPSIIYSGCFVRAYITFFAYTKNGNGVGAALNSLQFARDGEPLDSRGQMPVKAAAAFAAAGPLPSTPAFATPGLPPGGAPATVPPQTSYPPMALAQGYGNPVTPTGLPNLP